MSDDKTILELVTELKEELNELDKAMEAMEAMEMDQPEVDPVGFMNGAGPEPGHENCCCQQLTQAQRDARDEWHAEHFPPSLPRAIAKLPRFGLLARAKAELLRLVEQERGYNAWNRRQRELRREELRRAELLMVEELSTSVDLVFGWFRRLLPKLGGW